MIKAHGAHANGAETLARCSTPSRGAASPDGLTEYKLLYIL